MIFFHIFFEVIIVILKSLSCASASYLAFLRAHGGRVVRLQCRHTVLAVSDCVFTLASSHLALEWLLSLGLGADIWPFIWLGVLFLGFCCSLCFSVWWLWVACYSHWGFQGRTCFQVLGSDSREQGCAGSGVAMRGSEEGGRLHLTWGSLQSSGNGGRQGAEIPAGSLPQDWG